MFIDGKGDGVPANVKRILAVCRASLNIEGTMRFPFGQACGFASATCFCGHITATGFYYLTAGHCLPFKNQQEMLLDGESMSVEVKEPLRSISGDQGVVFSSKSMPNTVQPLRLDTVIRRPKAGEAAFIVGNRTLTATRVVDVGRTRHTIDTQPPPTFSGRCVVAKSDGAILGVISTRDVVKSSSSRGSFTEIPDEDLKRLLDEVELFMREVTFASSGSLPGSGIAAPAPDSTAPLGNRISETHVFQPSSPLPLPPGSAAALSGNSPDVSPPDHQEMAAKKAAETAAKKAAKSAAKTFVP